jgi:hypothetical protein
LLNNLNEKILYFSFLNFDQNLNMFIETKSFDQNFLLIYQNFFNQKKIFYQKNKNFYFFDKFNSNTPKNNDFDLIYTNYNLFDFNYSFNDQLDEDFFFNLDVDDINEQDHEDFFEFNQTENLQNSFFFYFFEQFLFSKSKTKNNLNLNLNFPNIFNKKKKFFFLLKILFLFINFLSIFLILIKSLILITFFSKK